MEEVWKDIVGYEGLYQVNNLGKIKSLKRVDNNNHIVKEKILKGCYDKDGYLKVILYNGKNKTYRVHRLVAQTFIPNPDNKPQVNHISGNKKDNSIQNLEWVTSKENVNHAWKTGLSKMTDERINKMKESHKGSKNYFYGKPHTEEAKRKMSENKKGKYTGENSPVSRKVKCITTGEIFNSLSEASKLYNINASNLCNCCKGIRKSAGKHPITKEKLKWKYLE